MFVIFLNLTPQLLLPVFVVSPGFVASKLTHSKRVQLVVVVSLHFVIFELYRFALKFC